MNVPVLPEALKTLGWGRWCCGRRLVRTSSAVYRQVVALEDEGRDGEERPYSTG
jgi:hypothetical protein